MNDLSTEVKEVILGQKADKLIFKGDYMEVDERISSNPYLVQDQNVPEILRNANGFEDAKLVIMNNAPLYNQLKNYYPEYIQEKNIQYPVPFDEFSNNDENIVVENFLKDKFNIEVDQNDSQGTTLYSSHKDLITEGDYTDYKEMTFALPNIDADFTKGHYKDKNIFAHARFNTREIDGKKTLFIEELQSDWVHKGKDAGFKDDNKYFELRKEQQRLFKIKSNIVKDIKEQGFDGIVVYPVDATEEQQKIYTDADNAYKEIENKLKATSNAVPDLPFKKNW